jgi:hypothetical protein
MEVLKNQQHRREGDGIRPDSSGRYLQITLRRWGMLVTRHANRLAPGFGGSGLALDLIKQVIGEDDTEYKNGVNK